MEYRRLGRSGLKLSALSYGSWVTFGTALDDAGARDCLALAYERGVNFFDSAEVYLGGEAERMLGRAIKALGWPRDSFCVSSKVLYGTGDNHDPAETARPTQQGLSRKHIIEACEQALQRFGLDYLDLYLCHRPDPDMSLPEIAFTMDSLIRQGKVLYWGTSEWPASDIEALIAFADRNHLIPPQVEQPQYNLFHRARVEQEYRSIAETHGVGLTTWSPLASGVLAGRYDDGIPPGSRLTAAGFSWLSDFVFAGRQEEMRAAARRLQGIAADLGSSRAQLAIAWCLANPSVSTVILGASSNAQLAHNLAAIEFVEKLTPEIRESISQAMSFKPDRPI
ncbi:voltage-dependent potassium channel beta subunit, animal [Pseudoxanthobacter soli DSM 19599]|uniref:Voltage-dependent potassium channel beta subunit, animal n=1 Tax=Pseudoxanthobacter soli DSM 19599 TaxID=1123029 RepID=A0A1M7Z8T7_9HYPH|nr:aldo/keto reductase [Pseudoxanthobacter soli]SHO61249.1 voltage-dependent potassium channel beta subunit, animal [Pseudoxanthobacter soli DSM 19599]